MVFGIMYGKNINCQELSGLFAAGNLLCCQDARLHEASAAGRGKIIGEARDMVRKGGKIDG